MTTQPAHDHSTNDLPHRAAHILIAPNAFKNALPADEAAAAIQRGLSQSRLLQGGPAQRGLIATTECFPVGDGGDGTGDLLLHHLSGQRVAAKARDPLGRTIDTWFGIVRPNIAVIEMANASGLRLLDPAARNPLTTSSAGTGDLIRAALDHLYPAAPKTFSTPAPFSPPTAEPFSLPAPEPFLPPTAEPFLPPTAEPQIVLAMGGSATVDGGAGILQALGARFLNADAQPLTQLPSELGDLADIDLSGLDPRLATTKLIVLCDVTNPLTGPRGAAAVFGPQKGADPAAVRQLEVALQRLSAVIRRQTGIDLSDMPRSGTAGGAAAGLHGLLKATLVSGIDYFLEITGFNTALDRSTHVITGEGHIDQQTLQGKAPFGVATRAKSRGIAVIALTGRPPKDPAPLRPYFDEIISITPPRTPTPKALADTAANLERAAMEWGNRLAAAT